MVSVDQLNSSFKGKDRANSQMSVVTNTLIEGTESLYVSLVRSNPVLLIVRLALSAKIRSGHENAQVKTTSVLLSIN